MNSFLDVPRQPTRRAHLYWAEGLLLLAGLICFGWFGYNWIASETDQLWSNYELDASLLGQKPTVRGFVEHLLSGKPSAAEQEIGYTKGAEEPPQILIPRGENIGRIEIPRLNISAIVRQGVDEKVLSRAVGHVPSTALPGHKGNVALAAHRDSYFRNLRDVREGDLIRVVTPTGTFEYEVDSLTIVSPSNVEVLEPTPSPALTLVTCYPFNFIGHAPKRFIVRARQKGALPGETLSVATPKVPAAKKHRAARRRS